MSEEQKKITDRDFYRLEFEIEKLKKEQDQKEKELKEIRDALYEPDKGLYRRITATSEQTEEQHKMIKALEIKVSGKNDSFDTRLRNLEEVNKLLVEISGPNLESLRFVVEKKKKTDKLWWGMATAGIAGFIKVIWDIIAHLM